MAVVKDYTLDVELHSFERTQEVNWGRSDVAPIIKRYYATPALLAKL
jgi:hypothetical protein